MREHSSRNSGPAALWILVFKVHAARDGANALLELFTIMWTQISEAKYALQQPHVGFKIPWNVTIDVVRRYESTYLTYRWRPLSKG